MPFLYKPDWEQAKQRLTAWWHHEAIDWCALAMSAQRTDRARFTPPPLHTRVKDRLQIFIPPEELEQAFDELGARGSTSVCNPKAQPGLARYLLEMAPKWADG
jgi:hypothetical protein